MGNFQWLKPQLLSTSYPLPGFVLIRNDRLNKRGGGVAIYLRSDFSFNISFKSPPNSSAEYLFLEVCVRGVKLILGVVYCPPVVDYFTEFESVLESLGSEYEHHIIMGDFNTDILSLNSSRSRKLLNLLESSSLHVLPLQATHHNLNGEDTLLDLIITSTLTKVIAHGQHLAPSFSHHDLIFITYKIKTPKPKAKVMHRRCFRYMNLEELRKDASHINWEPLTMAGSVDEKVEILNNTILNLYNIHAPVKKIKLKHPPAPWLTDSIRKVMRNRDRAFRRYKKARCDDNWLAYKTARNKCNQVIRNAKRRYILESISTSSPADIWKFLGTLGIGRERHTDFPTNIALDDINHHFTTSTSLNHRSKSQTLDYVAHLPRPNISSFDFSPVAPEEVKKFILSIKSNATGCDEISRFMVTAILEHLLPAITYLINYSLDSNAFPSLWRKAYVRPLAKVPNPSLPIDFRPISILPFLSKVLEACVHKQLSQFVHKHNFLNVYQSGFRPGHSTETALLKVTLDIKAAAEEGKLTVLALIDFSNAFNTVSHDILLAILSHFMISDDALEWFSSYLRGRQQSVRIDESSSTWAELDSGVPQGGILSPLLFSLFIDFITRELQCSYHLYADDLQIYSHARVENLEDAVNSINQDLENIKNWSARFGLTVNPIKCQAIITGSPRMICRIDRDNVPEIIFNGAVLPISASVKDLGLHIDTNMNWQTQVASVSQKVTNILRGFYRLKNFLPTKIKTMLVQTLIFPIVDYGDVCYLDLNADLLNKLDRLLNNCIRFIFNLRKYDHISSYRKQLSWLPIRQRRNLRALSMLYSLLYSPNSPTYLKSHIQYLCSNHDRNLRSSNNLLLLCPAHTSSKVHCSFLVQAVTLWNALPLEIRMSTSRSTFKFKVRDHYRNMLMESSE